MILTKKEILKEIETGKIKIVPFKKSNIGPASIDLTLDNQFGIPKKGKITLSENANYKNYIKKIKANSIKLKPEDFILGITKEKISLPENIMGLLSGRSRFARFGLLIHATAPLIQPGINNKQVFEIKNIGNSTLVLKAGLRLGQLALLRMEGKAKYRGKFAKQNEI